MVRIERHPGGRTCRQTAIAMLVTVGAVIAAIVGAGVLF